MQNNSVENPSFILLLLSHHPKRINKLPKNPKKIQTNKPPIKQTNKQTNNTYK
jgi:hypothetical protein